MLTKVVFELTSDPAANPPIFAGLYPPAKSTVDRQHNNVTSTAIAAVLGHRNFGWVDILPYCPDNNGGLDQKKLGEFLAAHPEYRKDWADRIVARVTVIRMHIPANKLPVTFLCGETDNKEWESLDGYAVEYVNTLDPAYGVVMYRTTESKQRFLAVVGHPHPSAHLMAGGEAKARYRFRTAMSVVKGLQEATCAPGSTWEDTVLQVTSRINAKERNRRVMMAAFMEQYLEIPDGRWPNGTEKARHLPFDDDDFTNDLEEIIGLIGIKGVMRLLRTNSCVARLGVPTFRATVMRLLKRDPVTGLKLLSSNSFSSRYGSNTAFTAMADKLLQEDPDRATRLLSSGSFTCRYGPDIAFTTMADQLLQEDPDGATRLLSCDGFTCRYGSDAAFTTVADTMMKTDTKTAVRLLSTGSFTTRYTSNKGFKKAADRMFKTNPVRALKLFSTNSFCSRYSSDVKFQAASKKLVEAYPEWATKLLSTGSFAARYGTKPTFTDTANALLKKHGSTAVNILSKDHVCSRIGQNTKFDGVFKRLTTLGEKYDVPAKEWGRVICCSAVPKVLDLLAKDIATCGSRTDLLKLIKKYAGHPHDVLYRCGLRATGYVRKSKKKKKTTGKKKKRGAGPTREKKGAKRVKK